MIDMEWKYPHEAYPHIDSIWQRVPKGEVHEGAIIVGQWTRPDFEYLAANEWIGTEKVDGVNTRIQFYGAIPHSARFATREEGVLYPKLEQRLTEMFLLDEARMAQVVKQFEGAWEDGEAVTLYGEGYGAGIRKGGKYHPNGVDFVLFDVAVGNWWLKREAVEEVAHNLCIDVAPITFRGTLRDACQTVSLGMTSTWGDFEAEGLVLQPTVQMFNRQGKRIITKIKTKDYLRFVTPYGLSEPRSAKRDHVAIEQGLADIAAGRTTPWSQVKEELGIR